MLKIVNIFQYFVSTKEGIASRITVTSFYGLAAGDALFFACKMKTLIA
jgi:hypothetical protein